MASNFEGSDDKPLQRQSDFPTEKHMLQIQRVIIEEIQRNTTMTSLRAIYWAVRQRFSDVKDRLNLDNIQNRISEMIATLKALQLKQNPAIENNGHEPVKLKNRKGEKDKKENAKSNQLVAYECYHFAAIEEEKDKDDKELKRVLLQSRIDCDDQMEFEPAKLKHRKGEMSSKETAKSNQLVACDHFDFAALQEEKDKDDKELKRVLLQSRIDFDDQIEFEKKLKETLAKSYHEEKSKLLDMLSADNIDFSVLVDQLSKVWPDKTSIEYKGGTLNDISALILAIIELFEYDHTIIDATSIQNHIMTLIKRCLTIRSNVIYQKSIHKKNLDSTFNVFSINDYLVNIAIRGDGNCMWGSVSHSLFGDYSMMQSLRLLTANALKHCSEQFLETLTRQTSKFSYDALTLEQLIKASVSLQSWGDEFHLMALSLTLKRPIYSYGSLINIPESSYMGYEQFRQSYEIETFPNHFKFIGDTSDANNEPILLHYDGFSHYSSVLKTTHVVKPLVPFTQIIDALFNGNEMAQPGEAEELIDIDSRVTDGGQSHEIAKLNNELRDKVVLLRQYESFFQKVKKMLDSQKIDLGLLQDLVNLVENSRK